MNGHPRDQAKVSVHCMWPLIRGNLTLKCVGQGIDNVAVQGRWPLTTGVAQGRYYCSWQNYLKNCLLVASPVLLCQFQNSTQAMMCEKIKVGFHFYSQTSYFGISWSKN